MTHTAQRYHDISCGHRVVGHEGKCRFLHGHNYRIHFICVADQLDKVGRVVDFGVIKSSLCMWLEDNWDHKFLAWEEDMYITSIRREYNPDPYPNDVHPSFVMVPFNPTAENIAQYLVEVIAPKRLHGSGVKLIKCIVEETAKCSASFELPATVEIVR